MTRDRHLQTVEVAARAWSSLAAGRLTTRTGAIDVYLCIADHFEPSVGRPARSVARDRVDAWLEEYPRIAARHRDAEGRSPSHTFFYPYDQYDPWELDRLAELCSLGCGEVELHLHHRDDTEDSLRAKLRDALKLYRSHGVLSTWPDGRTAFGFVHGNWALDNSRCEGGVNFCGVNSEISVLQEEGCFADFTFPAWKQQSQPRQVNSIYYAVDDPQRPKSHDRGVPARAGVSDQPGLLMLQGPLVPSVEWHRGRPRLCMDDGDLAGYRRYSPERLDRWVRAGIHLDGRPDRIFVKLHCHGAADHSREELLGHDLDALFTDAEARYNDGVRFRLHYVSARETYNIIKATEAGVAAPCLRDLHLPSAVLPRESVTV